MKSNIKAFVTTLAALSWLFGAGITHAEIDIDLDVSLGSEIGDNVSSDEIMPFWGQVELGYELGAVTPYAVYGHTSSADINGGVEYAGEFYGIGTEVLIDQFFVSAQLVKYADNTIESEGVEVQMYEVGVNSEIKGVPLRFAAFYENATSGYLERMGLKLGYEFDLR